MQWCNLYTLVIQIWNIIPAYILVSHNSPVLFANRTVTRIWYHNLCERHFSSFIFANYFYLLIFFEVWMALRVLRSNVGRLLWLFSKHVWHFIGSLGKFIEQFKLLRQYHIYPFWMKQSTNIAIEKACLHVFKMIFSYNLILLWLINVYGCYVYSYCDRSWVIVKCQFYHLTHLYYHTILGLAFNT